MCKIILAAAIVLIGLMPAGVLAQAVPPAYTSERQANLTEVLAITGGAVVGLFTVAAISQDMLSTEALAVLGAGGLVIIGATAGALAGHKLFIYIRSEGDQP